MANIRVGDRVGAILDITEDNGMNARFLGFGVYAGDEVPPKNSTGLLTRLCHRANKPNPKIVLDTGEVVWGAQCWWMPEDKAKEILAKCHSFVMVSVENLRDIFRD